MIAPLVLGSLFFIYSALSGLNTINTTKLPEDFKKVNLKISNYEIKQISSKDDKNSWTLKSSKAYASADENKAKIIDPYLIFYEYGKEKFKISSKLAYLDKVEQEVILVNGVTLLSADGKYKINSGKLKFKESNKFLELNENWDLVSSDGYTIKGNRGLIDKSFDSITSLGSASLVKKGDKDVVIRGEKIELNSSSDTPIIASNSAVLDINGGSQKLYGNMIRIKKNNYIFANSNVRVVTPKMICESQSLEIIPNSTDKNPKTAIFRGNPHITQNNQTIYSDLITYDFATESAAIEGNVHSGN